MSPFTRNVYRVVRTIPRGRVVSYGGVAALLGKPRAARAVGRALGALPDGSDVPWWRVVNGAGEVSNRRMLHGRQVQRALLEAEGVRFDRRGRIDWSRFGWSPAPASSRPRVRSVSLAIREPGGDRLLLVRRPPDDAELPDAWGLPAASLRPNETWEAAARRAARDKLGISVRLHGVANEGEVERAGRVLAMRLYDAAIHRGRPDVPGSDPDVTQYTAWQWGERAALRPAARRGSLCCRLALNVPVSRRSRRPRP